MKGVSTANSPSHHQDQEIGICMQTMPHAELSAYLLIISRFVNPVAGKKLATLGASGEKTVLEVVHTKGHSAELIQLNLELMQIFRVD